MSHHLLMALGPTLLGVFALAYPALALQPPDVPFSPYGTIRVSNNDVSDGTIVSAWCGGVSYRQTASATTAGASWYFNLDIPGDDPETPSIKEGCTPSETVTFKIGDLTAHQTAPWISGSGLRLDLTASSSASPTPSATRTPPNTPSPTATPTTTPTPTNTPVATATAASTTTRMPTGTPASTATRSSTPDRVAPPPATATKTPAPTRTPKPTRTPRKRATPVRATIEGYTWQDKDHNEAMDELEGIPGAKVILRPAAASQQPESTEELVAVSDASGNYLFEDVAPGSYTVQVRAPRGYRAAIDAPASIVVIEHQTEQLDIQLYRGATLFLPLVLRP